MTKVIVLDASRKGLGEDYTRDEKWIAEHHRKKESEKNEELNLYPRITRAIESRGRAWASREDTPSLFLSLSRA